LVLFFKDKSIGYTVSFVINDLSMILLKIWNVDFQ